MAVDRAVVELAFGVNDQHCCVHKKDTLLVEDDDDDAGSTGECLDKCHANE